MIKKLSLFALTLFSFQLLRAQATQFNGSWALCKIITAKGDTQNINSSDIRYKTYNFTYNNTFTSFHKEQNEEISGVWSYEFKTKTIKLRNAVFTKSRAKAENSEMVIFRVSPTAFTEMKEEGKKSYSYAVYCRTK